MIYTPKIESFSTLVLENKFVNNRQIVLIFFFSNDSVKLLYRFVVFLINIL